MQQKRGALDLALFKMLSIYSVCQNDTLMLDIPSGIDNSDKECKMKKTTNWFLNNSMSALITES